MYAAHIEKLCRIRLADVLVEENVLDRARVEEAQAEQEQSGRQLGELLVQQEILTEYDLAKLITTRYSVPYVELTGYQTKREVMTKLPLDFCEKYSVLPLDEFGPLLTLAVAELPDLDILQSIADQTRMTPCLFVALRRSIQDVLAEERKRASGKAAKSPAKAAEPAKQAAKAPAVAPTVVAAKAEAPLPDLDLPIVSMKLVGAAAQKVAPSAHRVSVVREVTPAAPGAKSGAALGWMDTAAGTANPRVTKFGSPAPAGAAAPAAARSTNSGLKPGTAPTRAATSAGGRPATSAGGEAPKTGPIGTPRQTSAGGAWQTIFDVAEESMKKPK